MPKGKRKLSIDQSQTGTPVAPVSNEQQQETGEGVEQSISKTVEQFHDEREQVKPKRKYTRRVKEEEQQEENKNSERLEGLKQNFSVLASYALEIVCKRMPNPIPATEQEKELFGRVTGDLISKYSDTALQYGEESAFVLVAVTIFAPRFIKQENKKEQMEIPFTPIIPE